MHRGFWGKIVMTSDGYLGHPIGLSPGTYLGQFSVTPGEWVEKSFMVGLGPSRVRVNIR